MLFVVNLRCKPHPILRLQTLTHLFMHIALSVGTAPFSTTSASSTPFNDNRPILNDNAPHSSSKFEAHSRYACRASSKHVAWSCPCDLASFSARSNALLFLRFASAAFSVALSPTLLRLPPLFIFCSAFAFTFLLDISRCCFRIVVSFCLYLFSAILNPYGHY